MDFLTFPYPLMRMIFLQVSADELERRRIRRERNKVAASKCRKKRKEHVKTLVEVKSKYKALQPRSQGFSPPRRGWAHPLLGGEKSRERGWKVYRWKNATIYELHLELHTICRLPIFLCSLVIWPTWSCAFVFPDLNQSTWTKPSTATETDWNSARI